MAADRTNSEETMKKTVLADAEDALEILQSRTSGLDADEIATSRTKYGGNSISDHRGHAILKRLYYSFVNVFIITLAVIDVLWMVLDPDIIYFIILTSLIIISGTVTFIQETRSNNSAAKLIEMIETTITVRRGGREESIDSHDLVVGDIVLLDTGDVVPADVRIVSSNHINVDQSSLTGESKPMSKVSGPADRIDSVLECDNLAFMGTYVTAGSAEAVVVAVGDSTVMGSMAESLSSRRVKTSYDKGSKQVAKLLIKLMVAMVPPVFIIMIAKAYFNTGGVSLDDLLEAVIFSMTLAVGLMPEMLTTIISTNLAKGAVTMSKRKVIVKDANSIQNLGAMDVLCSDKTGTLTENRISVQACDDIGGKNSSLVMELAYLNSSNLSSGTNQMDSAMMEYASGKNVSESVKGFRYVSDIPFDFIRRKATVVVGSDEKTMMISKGATPEILEICSRYLDADGDVKDLDEQAEDAIMDRIGIYGREGMRALAVAYKETGPSCDESDLTFAGLVLFSDPEKPSAAKAVKEMAEYGIKVKVLTGDNEYVSNHVCNRIGIKCRIDDGSEDGRNAPCIITGPMIDGMDDSELGSAVETHDVFVRLTPDNKARVVSALRDNGHCVGVMGDGINDVLAMRRADVSLSVNTGTDITKETANMILLEKDLGILKDGAIEGRRVYVNTIKYVKMIASINFGYMFSLILATLLFNFEPMGGLMILIYNVINDLACMVIPWDNVDEEFVREPRNWDAVNLKNVMVRFGPVSILTDVLSWAFFVFIIFGSIDLSSFTVLYADGTPMIVSGYDTVGDLILGRANLSNTNVEAMFQGLWYIEQYWMQVWAIHIIRTNKVPFLQSMPAKALILTTVMTLIIGTVLPLTGDIWGAISGFPVDLFASAFMPIAWMVLLWSPFIAVLYMTVSHLVKKRMLRTHGYFAC